MKCSLSVGAGHVMNLGLGKGVPDVMDKDELV